MGIPWKMEVTSECMDIFQSINYTKDFLLIVCVICYAGPVVMLWSWVTVGSFTLILVSCLGEICSAYPTMGALYYWAYRLGGPEWGPFCSWICGWANLLGQIAGVASGGYSGAELIANISALTTGYQFTNVQFLFLYALVLTIAGIVNTFAETLLTSLCYISVTWHIVGVIVIVSVMIQHIPSSNIQPAGYVAMHFHNGSNFESSPYVALIGILAAASTFTGHDTGAHVAEETNDSHKSSPVAMFMSVVNCIFLGLLLIVGTLTVIQQLHYIITMY
jgi:amino acid transporter